MENLIKDLEKCQDELKVIIRFDGSSVALDKMLKKKKHSKDTEGLGCDADECSTNKNVSHKDIQFVSSNGNNKRQTFTIRNAPRRKIDLTTTGEDMRMKTGTARRNNVNPKGKGNLREDIFTRSKKLRGKPRRPPTSRRQRNVVSHKICPRRSKNEESKLVRSSHV